MVKRRSRAPVAANVSSHMKRVWFAFFLAPLLLCLPFGALGLVLFYFLALVTAVLAVPLFFLLRRLRWLQWWHALLVGLFCAASFIVFDAFMKPGGLDFLISANSVTYLGWGAAVSVLFWWLGVFRNLAFPYVPNRPPLSFALILPLFLAGFAAREALAVTSYKGRVQAIVRSASDSDWGKASVRLTDGPIVDVDFTNTWPESMIVGKCFHLMNYWSTLRMRRVNELISPLGGGVDDC